MQVDRPRQVWRVGKKLIAWERPLRMSDHEALTALGIEPPLGDMLGVRVADEGIKFALIADEPNLYFTTPHSTAIRPFLSDSPRSTRWPSAS